jgi:hypothetical protein
VFTRERGFAEEKVEGGRCEDGEEDCPPDKRLVFHRVPAQMSFGVEEAEIKD